MTILNDFTPMIVDAVIPQGSDSFEVFHLYLDAAKTQPFNLENCVIRSKIRASYDGKVLLDLSTENGTIVIGMKEENGNLTQGSPENGAFTVKYISSSTSAIKFRNEELECVRDIEVVDVNNFVKRVVSGTITFTRESTR